MAWRQGQSYSEDLRGRVLAAVDDGMAARPFVDPSKLVFIDETGASTKMTRLWPVEPHRRAARPLHPGQCANYFQAAGYGKSY